MSAGVDTVDNLELLLDLNRLRVSEEPQIIYGALQETKELPSNSSSQEKEVLKQKPKLKDEKKTRRQKKRAKKKLNKNEHDEKLDRMNRVTREITDEKVILTMLNEMAEKFSIQAIRSQKTGTVIRLRDTKCHNINLDSYGYSHEPVIFVSKRWEESHRETSENVLDECPGQTHRQTVHKNGIASKKSRKTVDKGKNLQSVTSQGKARKKQRKRVYSNSKLDKGHGFEDYWKIEDVETGLSEGELIKGVIRINPKNHKNAYVNNEDRTSQDYLISSLLDRNRALEADVVILKIKPEEEWKNGQKTANVVYIYEKIHPRTAIGCLSVLYDRGCKIAALQPRDKKMPRIMIPKVSLPPTYFKNAKDFEEVLYLAKITDWTEQKFAVGVLIDRVGTSNELNSETKALLLENQLDVQPFPPSVYSELPTSSQIPEKEFEYREDLRKECVFTIDPITARDLDDSVSCKELPNGNLEVGVHIADVTHYVQSDMELDKIVAKKATTIYLVNNVFHMLPVELCLHCSLLPGKDALAFSVFWEMTREGDIVNTRFARTIINSCCQLAYEHAQKMIENPENFARDDMPDIENGFSADDLSRIVNDLQKIAVVLRQKRFDSGALKLDQVKVTFRLDANGEPTEFFVYENKDAHRLIEEFMLLANISVARKLNEDFPEIAFLRCHEPPNPRLMLEIQQFLEEIGIHIDISSSRSLHDSLQKYSSPDYLGVARNAVLNHIFAKPMTRAKYFCTSDSPMESFEHYALSVPLYTHFTSPIRRYADIMVHRLLAASLGYSERPEWNVRYVEEIAAICNMQKYNAKRAGEASSDLYLVHYIERNQPFVEDAVVVDVKEKSFDALVLTTGSVIRIYVNDLGDNMKCHSEQFGNSNKKIWKMCIIHKESDNSPETMQIIEMFHIVKVGLKRKGKTNSLEGEIVRPDLVS